MKTSYRSRDTKSGPSQTSRPNKRNSTFHRVPPDLTRHPGSEEQTSTGSACTEALRKTSCSPQSQSGKMESRLTRLRPTGDHPKTGLLSGHGRTQFQQEQSLAKPRSTGAPATAQKV